MSEKIRVGLSRCRLFEFNNTVVFCAKCVKDYSVDEYNRALRLLCLKEPLITAKACLDDESTCFIVTDAVEQAFAVSSLSAQELRLQFDENGIDFNKRLFSFALSADGYVVIGAHTLVADVKSLMRLAMSFAYLCSAGVSSVTPADVVLFSDKRSLPLEVNSPLTDKLSAELNAKWHKSERAYRFDDYESARVKYKRVAGDVAESVFCIDEDTTASLKAYCAENFMDFSSLVAFCFYKKMRELTGATPKNSKICINSDRRLFLNDVENCFVGPFNGLCEVGLGAKESKLSVQEQAKAFHLNCYKCVTSPFKSFYDESLFMSLSPAYCDSMFMYMAGAVTDKASGKLACNYGCMNEKLFEFFACNTEQQYWSGLECFSDIVVYEPLKNRFCASITLLTDGSEARLLLRYRTQKINRTLVEQVFDSVKKMLLEFKG